MPDRSNFIGQIGEALWRSRRDANYNFAVVALDVRRLKAFNGTFGYNAGDQLLMAVARRLSGIFIGSAELARIGGDKYAILAETGALREAAREFAERVRDVFAAPFDIYERSIAVEFTFGVALGSSAYSHADDVLACAEMATDEAKASRSGIAIFDDTRYAKAKDRLLLETELHSALDHNELTVYYQPLVSLTTGKITGVEALVRWLHPERGIIPPSEFIPIAEATGFITSIDEFVLRTASAQLRQWQERSATDLHMAVNLSRRDLEHGVARRMVAEALKSSGISPESLEVEVTESLAMSDALASITALRELKDDGVSIAMDDFGTGYSSLGALAGLPINTVKIDRSFISSIEADARVKCIVQSIVEMAHTLGLRVIAEGLETQEQLGFLKSIGCDEAQGYLFSSPVPADKIAGLLGCP